MFVPLKSIANWFLQGVQDRANGIIESSYFLIIWSQLFPVASLLCPLFLKGLTTQNFTQDEKKKRKTHFFYPDKQSSPTSLKAH